jgi:predicted lipid-binding transport protein (Tim44 family)
MSAEAKRSLMSALIGGAVGMLLTGFLSLLLVGGELHKLEASTSDKLSTLTERVARVEERLSMGHPDTRR